MKKPLIIPVASGKGGVGKSLLTANLAMALAGLGHPTVAVDLDLGGANLHTYLGLPNKFPGIGDFLKGGSRPFQELLVPTEFANLRFLPGDGRTPFMANIPFEQRLTLMQEIQKIPARFILLDLGAGSSFNTLNFFGLGRHGLLVTTFDTPAVMNVLMFLRNFVFRLLSSVVRRHSRPIFEKLVHSFRQPLDDAPLTVQSLLAQIKAGDPRLARQVQRWCGSYRPRILFNMGDHPEDLRIAPSIRKSLRQTLSMETDFVGFLFHELPVRKAVQQKKILLRDFPRCPAAREISSLARRIAEGEWPQPLPDNEKKLLAATRALYRRMQGSAAAKG